MSPRRVLAMLALAASVLMIGASPALATPLPPGFGDPIYLHRNNCINHVFPVQTTAAIADSSSVNFAGGNPWKTVGQWDNNCVGGTALGPEGAVHLWVGLKNSDDQGTSFDIQAVVTEGYITTTVTALCVTGITRNPANAKEVVIPLGYVGGPASTFVTIKTRIGTTDGTTKCPGHNNAVGLRLYYDSTTRPSGIWEDD